MKQNDAMTRYLKQLVELVATEGGEVHISRVADKVEIKYSDEKEALVGQAAFAVINVGEEEQR